MRHLYPTILAAVALAAAGVALAQQAPPPQTRYDLPSNWGQQKSTMHSNTWGASEAAGPDMTPRRRLIAPAQVKPVPEPSQWALMGAGLGLVAWIVRRRSTRNKD